MSLEIVSGVTSRSVLSGVFCFILVPFGDFCSQIRLQTCETVSQHSLPSIFGLTLSGLPSISSAGSFVNLVFRRPVVACLFLSTYVLLIMDLVNHNRKFRSKLFGTHSCRSDNDLLIRTMSNVSVTSLTAQKNSPQWSPEFTSVVCLFFTASFSS